MHDAVQVGGCRERVAAFPGDDGAVGAAGATVGAQIVINRHGAVGKRHVQAVTFGVVVQIPGLHGEVDAEDRGHIAVGLGAEHAHGTRRAVFGDQHPAQLVGDIKALGRRQAGVGAGNQTVAAHVEAFTVAAHAHPVEHGDAAVVGGVGVAGLVDADAFHRLADGEVAALGGEVGVIDQHVRVGVIRVRVAGHHDAVDGHGSVFQVGQVGLHRAVHDHGQGLGLDAVHRLVRSHVAGRTAEHAAVNQDGVVGFFRDVGGAAVEHQVHRVTQQGVRAVDGAGRGHGAVGGGGVFDHVQAAVVGDGGVTHVGDHQGVAVGVVADAVHVGGHAGTVRGDDTGAGHAEAVRHIVVGDQDGAVGHGQEHPVGVFVVGQIPGVAGQGRGGQRRGAGAGGGAVNLDAVAVDVGGHDQAGLMGDRHAFQIGRAGGGEGAVQGGHRGGAVLAVEKFVQGLYAAGHRGVVGGVHVTEQIQHDAFVGVGVEGGLNAQAAVELVDLADAAAAVVHHQQGRILIAAVVVIRDETAAAVATAGGQGHGQRQRRQPVKTIGIQVHALSPCFIMKGAAGGRPNRESRSRKGIPAPGRPGCSET